MRSIEGGSGDRLISWLCLILGIVAYGIGGANLSAGSTGGFRSALSSKAWWLGTGCQGIGFLLTLVARRELPLMLVQSGIVSALSVTAFIEHRAGRHRLRFADSLAIGAVILGVILIGSSSLPGKVDAPSWRDAQTLLVIVAVVLATLPVPPKYPAADIIHGCASGAGFGAMAVAARLVVSSSDQAVWRFWEFGPVLWTVGVLGAAGLALAQIHLTVGLARGSSVIVLGSMYGIATGLAAVVGWTLLEETPRPGAVPVLVGGLILGGCGALRLIRHVEKPHEAAGPQM